MKQTAREPPPALLRFPVPGIGVIDGLPLLYEQARQYVRHRWTHGRRIPDNGDGEHDS